MRALTFVMSLFLLFACGDEASTSAAEVARWERAVAPHGDVLRGIEVVEAQRVERHADPSAVIPRGPESVTLRTGLDVVVARAAMPSEDVARLSRFIASPASFALGTSVPASWRSATPDRVFIARMSERMVKIAVYSAIRSVVVSTGGVARSSRLLVAPAGLSELSWLAGYPVSR